MAEYDNNNRGALFKNDDKQEDTHADYQGSINAAGVDYWLSAWIKTSKAGAKYMQLTVKPKEAKRAAKPVPAGASIVMPDDPDIPF